MDIYDYLDSQNLIKKEKDIIINRKKKELKNTLSKYSINVVKLDNSESEEDFIARKQVSNNYLYQCKLLVEEQEAVRVYELDWFRLPVLNLAEISFNFGHLPTEMKYGDHYTIAIYVSPSVCEEQRCVGGGSRDRVVSLDVVDREYGVVDKSTKTPWWWKTGPEADGFDDDMITNVLDAFPCTQPVPMPDSFLSTDVDKHGVNKFQMFVV